MIYLELFLSFLQIGAFSFGGGYAAMPLIQEQVVTIHNWLTLNDFHNLITVSQMTPGPISVNSATFVGNKIAGPLGAVCATLGCVLPSCILVTVLAYLYKKYKNLSLLQDTLSALRPAVVSLIATAGVSIFISAIFVNSDINFRMIVYFTGALILLRKFKVNPIIVMLLCGLAELLFTVFFTS